MLPILKRLGLFVLVVPCILVLLLELFKVSVIGLVFFEAWSLVFLPFVNPFDEIEKAKDSAS